MAKFVVIVSVYTETEGYMEQIAGRVVEEYIHSSSTYVLASEDEAKKAKKTIGALWESIPKVSRGYKELRVEVKEAMSFDLSAIEARFLKVVAR